MKTTNYAKIALTALCLASAGVAAGTMTLAPAAYAKGKQADDGANHNKNDKRGGGKDDPAGHR